MDTWIASMLPRRTLILGAACAAIATPVPAVDAAALAFVTDIYRAYKGKNSHGHPLDSERAIRRYFEPSLAALMVKDQKMAARRGEVGLLDGDPFIDAQDWDISAFDIVVTDTVPGKASATVKFTNLDKLTTVVLDLVKIKNDWRISDITWLRDGKPETLRAIYAH
ncbi:MAG: DUF3828 domain-containing protein [Xanthobacteraceae bacterium]|nr:DUF3828 domain-containing protein [Xanthobacteraceae bacterium]